jgi:hypothetical protein
MNGLREFLDNIQQSFRTNISQYKNMNSITVIKSNLITIFIGYCKVINIVKENYKYIYDNHTVIRSIVDHSYYFYNYVYSFIIRKKIEPMQSYWISTSVLLKRDKNRYVGEEYTLLETYEYMKNPYISMENQLVCETSYNESCDATDSIVLNCPTYLEGMVKMKLGDNYVYRIFDNNVGYFQDFKTPLIPSKVSFLSIEYTHPLMKKSISIELDKSVYFENNHILSPIFVKLYLEYQPELYHFDMDYVLKIMDSDINTFQVGFNKSILLTADGYKIV